MSFIVNLKEAAYEAAHSFLVGSRPVDSAAGWASVELGLRIAHARRKVSEHLVPRNAGEGFITPQAAGEGAEEVPELKSADDILELFPGVFRPDRERASEPGIAGERPVSAQEDPVFGERLPDQLFVLRDTGVRSVESQHSEMGGQFPEVHVEEEPGHPEGMGADLLDVADLEGFENRKECNAVAVVHRGIERDRSAVQKGKINCTRRNREGVDQIADGRHAFEGTGEGAVLPRGWEIVVEFRVAPHQRRSVTQVVQRSAASRTKVLYGSAVHVSAFTAPSDIVIRETFAATSASGAS